MNVISFQIKPQRTVSQSEDKTVISEPSPPIDDTSSSVKCPDGYVGVACECEPPQCDGIKFVNETCFAYNDAKHTVNGVRVRIISNTRKHKWEKVVL